jgi:hypothetical protein
MKLEIVKRYYQVDRRQIAFLKFIIEAYEGLAVLTTLDAAAGRVCLRIAPGCEAEIDMIITDLQRDILIEPCHVASQQGRVLHG